MTRLTIAEMDKRYSEVRESLVGKKFTHHGRIYTVVEARETGDFPITISRPDGFRTDVRPDFVHSLL